MHSPDRTHFDRLWCFPAVLIACCCLAEPAAAAVITQTGCGYTSGTSLAAGYGGTSWHCSSVDGFGTTTITASAIAEDESPWSASGQYSISDSAVIDAMGYTTGPVRSGFLEISASSLGEYGSASELVDSWTCSGPGFPCYTTTNLFIPVTLGVPFQFEIQVSYGGETGYAQGTISFSMFDVSTAYPGNLTYPGAAVTIMADAAASPEPGTLFLFAAVFAIAGVRTLCRGTSAFVRNT